MERGALVGDVGERGLYCEVFGIDQVDATDEARARQHFTREIAPATAPAARDVGEILLLVLGQQEEAKFVGAGLEPRCRGGQAQECRPERLLGIDVLEWRRLGAQEEGSPRGERPGLEGVREGAAGLAHGTRTARPMIRPLRSSWSVASASSSLRLSTGTGVTLPPVTRSIISFIPAGLPVTEPTIWQPVKANIGRGIEKVPPNRPTMISPPPRPSAPRPN